ncbi:MAG: 50S ribosomal protein L10 [Candidatus Magasanikbacteria bacterium]|nr:50S ribosomal protein L10 [Candidatus Magasanikbacteria bacterium]
MAKTKAQKATDLERLTEAFKASKGVVFVDYKGVTVKNVSKLRRAAEKANVQYVVAKKTLITLAAKNIGLDFNAKKLNGNIGVAFGQDEVTAAQVVANIGKEVEQIKILAGALEGAYIDATQVKALASLPSKQQLLGQLAGVLNAPLTGLVGTLSGVTRGFVTVLHGIEEKKA